MGRCTLLHGSTARLNTESDSSRPNHTCPPVFSTLRGTVHLDRMTASSDGRCSKNKLTKKYIKAITESGQQRLAEFFATGSIPDVEVADSPEDTPSGDAATVPTAVPTTVPTAVRVDPKAPWIIQQLSTALQCSDCPVQDAEDAQCTEDNRQLEYAVLVRRMLESFSIRDAAAMLQVGHVRLCKYD